MKLSIGLSAIGVLLAAGCGGGGSSTTASSPAPSTFVASDTSAPSTAASPDPAQACADLRDATLAFRALFSPGGPTKSPAEYVSGMEQTAAKFAAAAKEAEAGSPFQTSAQAAADDAAKEAASLKAHGPTDADHALLTSMRDNSNAAVMRCSSPSPAAS